MTTYTAHALADRPVADEIARCQQEIRQKPGEFELRVYYFQLLCVDGQWQRALNQLQVCAQLDAKAIPMAQTYREALRSELIRDDVFAGRRQPQVLGEPARWLGLLMDAQRREAEGNAAAAAGMRAAAFDEASAVPGRIDGQDFEWLADADSRLGPVMEAVINGQYYWIPFSQFAEIRIEPPADLRDLIWAPARFQFVNEGTTVALIPVRYCGSEKDEDSCKLSRLTKWVPMGEDGYRGLGQRLWSADASEHALLDVRHIVFDRQGGR